MTEQRTTSQQKSSLIINGIHLHSKVDPQKEAEIFCDKYEKEIYSNEQHIILGLGGGFHLNELIKRLYKAERKINITVIEPNIEMIQNYRQDFSQFAETPGLEFFSEPHDDLYLNKKFINTLCQKPAILIHKASYEANKNFFYNFLTYKAENNLAKYLANIDMELLTQLTTLSNSISFTDENIEKMSKSKNNHFEAVFWNLFQKI